MEKPPTHAAALWGAASPWPWSVSLQGLLSLSWRLPKQTQTLASTEAGPQAGRGPWGLALPALCGLWVQVWFWDFRRLGTAGLAVSLGLWAICTFLPFSEGGLLLGFSALVSFNVKEFIQSCLRCLEVWEPRCSVYSGETPVCSFSWPDFSFISVSGHSSTGTKDQKHHSSLASSSAGGCAALWARSGRRPWWETRHWGPVGSQAPVMSWLLCPGPWVQCRVGLDAPGTPWAGSRQASTRLGHSGTSAVTAGHMQVSYPTPSHLPPRLLSLPLLLATAQAPVLPLKQLPPVDSDSYLFLPQG